MGEPLWMKSPIDGRGILHLETYDRMFPRTSHLKNLDVRMEASRDSGVVIMNARTLVAIFMDLNKWIKLFPCIILKARIIDVLASAKCQEEAWFDSVSILEYDNNDDEFVSIHGENKSNRETYRSLVGILGADLECSVAEDHKIHLRLPAHKKKEQVQLEKSNIHRCSCCGEPLRVKSSFQQPLLVQNQASNATIFPQALAPSPRLLGPSRNDPLPHIRYTELKFSDTELEILEDEDITGKEDPKAVTVPLLTESKDPIEDYCKTLNYIRENNFFSIALSDSAASSPRAPEKPFRKLLTEKAGGGAEPLELNTASQVDGDIILSHLKQVRLDHKSLIALYMELDKERSASAIVTHQAMTMITHLQAEKAVM